MGIYEVNVRQYTKEGTLQAFQQHLPRIADMGITMLWFMPLTPIAVKERKGQLGSYYSCSDYVGINPEFGSVEDFKALVDEAHSLGMKVIIDWVANHTGWDHVWTVQHPDWYKHRPDGQFAASEGMEDIINLDHDNPAMRKGLIAAMQWWIDQFDLDGFRCDLAFWVPLHFWKEASSSLRSNKKLFWLAEMEPLDFPEYMQVFDAAYCWRWMHASEKTLDLKQLLPIMNDYRSIDGEVLMFTSNHDENSWNGSEYEKYGDAALMLAVATCTWPGIPLVYSGQEIPTKKRLSFFDKDELIWNNGVHLHSFYKTLLHLRKEMTGEFQRIYTSADERVLCYKRSLQSGGLVVLLNFTNKEVFVDIYDQSYAPQYNDLFTNQPITNRRFHLKPWQYVCLRK